MQKFKHIKMKKINFSDKFCLTQAVLDGLKTMTRRIVPQSVIDKYSMMEDFTIIDDAKYNTDEVIAVAQSYKDCINDILIAQRYKTDIVTLAFMRSKGWNNKMFVCSKQMPHHIRITDVKVEKLQDISDIDCLAEGINYYEQKGFSWCSTGKIFDTPSDAFASLIDKISGKLTFQSNPWVFVYEFELVD